MREERSERAPRGERGDRNSGHQPRLLGGKPFFQRKKGCPFSGPKAPKIDYKDVRMLQRYVSPYGKIMPCHITGVCAKKQRELATAIKRARILGLMPFTAHKNAPQPQRQSREG